MYVGWHLVDRSWNDTLLYYQTRTCIYLFLCWKYGFFSSYQPKQTHLHYENVSWTGDTIILELSRHKVFFLSYILAYMWFTAKASCSIFQYYITGKQTIKYSVLHLSASLFSLRDWGFHFKSPIACNPCLTCNLCCLSHFSERMSFAVFPFPSLLAPALFIIPFSMSVKMGLVPPPTWLPRCILPEPWFPISAHSISSADSRPRLFVGFGLICPVRDASCLSQLAVSDSRFSPADNKRPPVFGYIHIWCCWLVSNITSIVTPTPPRNIPNSL